MYDTFGDRFSPQILRRELRNTFMFLDAYRPENQWGLVEAILPIETLNLLREEAHKQQTSLRQLVEFHLREIASQILADKYPGGPPNDNEFAREDH